MPRIPKGETAGGIYLINRGNMKMQVFDDMEDYEYFLELLEKASKRENVEIHACCLMPNHFHLLLKERCVKVACPPFFLCPLFCFCFFASFEKGRVRKHTKLC